MGQRIRVSLERILTPSQLFPFKQDAISILEVEIQNQDKIRRVAPSVSQFHVYADDLRGMGTEPRHQESVSQSIPSITVKPGCHGNQGIKPGAC
jgi:hypothetical protein